MRNHDFAEVRGQDFAALEGAEIETTTVAYRDVVKLSARRRETLVELTPEETDAVAEGLGFAPTHLPVAVRASGRERLARELLGW